MRSVDHWSAQGDCKEAITVGEPRTIPYTPMPAVARAAGLQRLVLL
jgi:hypothetical protein